MDVVGPFLATFLSSRTASIRWMQCLQDLNTHPILKVCIMCKTTKSSKSNGVAIQIGSRSVMTDVKNFIKGIKPVQVLIGKVVGAEVAASEDAAVTRFNQIAKMVVFSIDGASPALAGLGLKIKKGATVVLLKTGYSSALIIRVLDNGTDPDVFYTKKVMFNETIVVTPIQDCVLSNTTTLAGAAIGAAVHAVQAVQGVVSAVNDVTASGSVIETATMVPEGTTGG